MGDAADHGGAPETTGRRPAPGLVEREREIAVLAGLAAATAAGRPGLLVVEGPVGIGKSALLDRLADRGTAAGLRVLRAHGDAVGQGVPFGLVRRLLTPLLADGEETPPRPLRAREPAAGQGGPRPDIDAMHAVGESGHEEVPYGVLLGLHRFLVRHAAREPLLLMVDDAQHADAASLRFLAHTARRLVGLPVLLALARRAGGGRRQPLLDEMAARPRTRILRPRPLSGSGVAEVLRRVTGSTDEEFARACLAATNGNPLLLTALLAALAHEGRPMSADALRAAGGGDALALFRGLLERVLRQEPAGVLTAVRAMAVLGDGAPAETCAQLAGLDTDAFVRAVQALAGIGLVTATPSGREWSFSHGPAREAVLAGMPPGRRAQAHLHAARLLLDGGAPADRVAGHLLMGPAPVTDAWAVTVLREAAHQATLRGALSQAVDLLRLCLPDDTGRGADPELLTDLGLAEARVDAHAGIRHLRLALRQVRDPERRMTVLTALAGALVRTEQAPEAVRLLAEHSGAGGTDGGPERGPDGGPDGGPEGGADGGPGGTDRDAPAAPAAPDKENALLLEAQRLLLSAWDRASFVETLNDVQPDLSLPGDTPGERAVLAGRAALCAAEPHRVAEALAAARRAVGRGLALDGPAFMATAATAMVYADHPEEADPVYRRLLETAPQTQAEPSYVSLLALRANAAHRLGRLTEAVEATTVALESAPPEGASLVFALPAAVRIHALLEQGDAMGAATAAGRLFEAAAEDAWSWNEFLGARGRLRLVEGRPEAALADLLECGRRQREWRRGSPAVSGWWYWAGLAHLAAGDTGSARELAERTVAAARAAALPAALGTALGLLAATGKAEEALPPLDEAEAVLTTASAPLELVRVRVARGRALHALGRVEEARDALRPALDDAHGLGARPLYQQARQALLATGARPRRPVSRGPASLTPGELQVARQAAEGRSNPEIAEALFVTQRTVEAHLTSVYRKLGLSGRRELRAVWPPER